MKNDDSQQITPSPTEATESIAANPVDPKSEVSVKPHVFSKPPQTNRFKRIAQSYWAKKRWTLPVTLLVLLGIVLAIPLTRYDVLGLFLQKDFSILVLDNDTKKPVTNAAVELAGSNTVTDNKGQVKLHIPVGESRLTVTKKYYKTMTAEALVPINQKNAPYQVMLQATGRQVPVVVVNKITGKPLVNAVVKASGSEGKTDKDGKVSMVLPADKASADASITAEGYVDGKGTIKITEQVVKENSFALSPAGKVYFLSKQSGKIDVVKTNLDGTERQTVLAGTGSEDQYNTVLLASRDWKYLALISRRDGGANDKIFLIDTATDKLSTMDEGNASFSATGWAGHRFVYQVYRNGYATWQPKTQALKSYDAESGKLTTLEETSGEGTSDYDYAYSRLNTVYIMGDEIVYNLTWASSYYGNKLNGKPINLLSVQPDGSGKKSLKDFSVPSNYSYYSIGLRLYGPDELYVQVPGATSNTYFEYEDGKVVSVADMTPEKFNQPYPTYLLSPSGKQTFWTEPRDGKNALFVGDTAGENGKQIASLSEYTQYGWYSDDYLFVSKEGSELYVMPVAGGTPFKISDYHKPNQSFSGYGYGYGGF